MIERTIYLDKLRKWKDQPIIKIVTGVRRCGKSTLLAQFRNRLLEGGVSPEQIISINFEDLSNEIYLDYHQLYSYLLSLLNEGKMNYIFLDEVQQVKDFQKVVDSLFLRPDVDIYLTGSNAHLLSGEIATLLTGRYIEIAMLPLSFKEFCSWNDENAQTNYRKYITTTSFPYTVHLQDEDSVRNYLTGIYNTVLLKDVVARGKIQDVELLERVTSYLANNIGNTVSLKGISDTLTSSGRKVSVHTVENYVKLLSDSYLFYPVNRYDIKGKEILTSGNKFYIADLGLRNLLFGIKNTDLGHILENVVFLELQRRGYQVFVGKSGAKEVDFVCQSGAQIIYCQVALSVRDESTLRRELEALESIKSHYPKYLLTLDEDPDVIHNGIIQTNVLDWLTNDR